MAATDGRQCVRCGEEALLDAVLEQTLNFCVDHGRHHGVHHVGMSARICRSCGYTEFWVKDPAHALGTEPGYQDHTIQEEDF